MKLNIKIKSIISAGEIEKNMREYTVKVEVLDNYDKNKEVKKHMILKGLFINRGFYAIQKNDIYDANCTICRNNSDVKLLLLTDYVYIANKSKNDYLRKLKKEMKKSASKEIDLLFDEFKFNMISSIAYDITVLDKYEFLKDKKKEIIFNACKEIYEKECFLQYVTNNFSYKVNINAVFDFFDTYNYSSYEEFSSNPFSLVYYGADYMEIINYVSLLDETDELIKKHIECLIYLILKYHYEQKKNICLEKELVKIELERKIKQYRLIFSNDIVDEVLSSNEFSKPLYYEADYFYLRINYMIERSIIRKINVLNNTDYSIDCTLKNFFDSNSNLSCEQREAIKAVFNNKLLIINGSAGTGKTYTVSKIIEAIKFVSNDSKIKLLAPTAKAAVKLSSVSSLDASTIHRAIQNSSASYQIINKKIDADYIIVDEASMIDNELLYCLLDVISNKTNLIFIGDINQLLPVKAGAGFIDLINSQKVKVVKLQQIYRQANDSNILKIANDILNNNFDIERYKNFNDVDIIKAKNDNDIRKNVEKLLDNYDVDTSIMLTISKDKEKGTYMLNNIIQKAYISNISDKFNLNDIVMQIENNENKRIYNGQVGKIIKKDKKIVVKFGEKEVEYDSSNPIEIELGYALTIHKSQGSEFDNVILILDEEHEFMITKNLMYTAVTRAKKHLTIIYSNKNINACVKKEEEIRHSNIAKKLK